MWVVVCGSRSIESVELVASAVAESGFDISAVVSGCARGVDAAAASWAAAAGVSVIELPANWGKFGKSAGMIRNREMLEIADAVIAIWDGKSRGTKHMIHIARHAGVPVYVKRAGAEGQLGLGV